MYISFSIILYIYIYLYTHTCIYIYIYVYIYTFVPLRHTSIQGRALFPALVAVIILSIVNHLALGTDEPEIITL